MARKRAHEHADERWLLTYADMITLLMALFMVMFSMAVVNKGEVRRAGQVAEGELRRPARPGRHVDPERRHVEPDRAGELRAQLAAEPDPGQQRQARQGTPRAAAAHGAGDGRGEGPRGRAGPRPRGRQGGRRPEDPRAAPRGQGEDGDQLEGPRDPPHHRQGAVRHRVVHDPARGEPAAELGRASRERHRHEPDPRLGATPTRSRSRETRTATTASPATAPRPSSYYLQDHGFDVHRHRDTAYQGFGSLDPLVPNDPATGAGPRNRRVEVIVQRINYLKAAEREAQGPLGSLPAGAAVDRRHRRP